MNRPIVTGLITAAALTCGGTTVADAHTLLKNDAAIDVWLAVSDRADQDCDDYYDLNGDIESTCDFATADNVRGARDCWRLGRHTVRCEVNVEFDLIDTSIGSDIPDYYTINCTYRGTVRFRSRRSYNTRVRVTSGPNC